MTSIQENAGGLQWGWRDIPFVRWVSSFPFSFPFPADNSLGIGKVRILYVNAPAGIEAWGSYNVSAGERIGTAESLQALGYSAGVTPHIHIQIMSGGSWVDPAPYIFGH